MHLPRDAMPTAAFGRGADPYDRLVALGPGHRAHGSTGGAETGTGGAR